MAHNNVYCSCPQGAFLPGKECSFRKVCSEMLIGNAPVGTGAAHGKLPIQSQECLVDGSERH
eukprot:4812801-Amphidinium_carterae.1